MYENITNKESSNLIVYKAISPSKKIYIGITSKSLNERIYYHNNYSKNNKKSNRHFSNAINKYGIENIKFEIIDYATSWEELCELEKYWIGYYDSYNNGYNMTLGGEGSLGYKYNDKRMENYLKYRNEHPEFNKNISIKLKEYFSKESNRLKQSNKRKMYYLKHPEAKKEMSEIKKEYYKNHPEKGIEHSKKIKKLFQENPEIKIKMSNSRKIYLSDKNNYIKMSIACGAKYFNVYDKNGNYVNQYLTQSECSRELNLNQSHIGSCLRKERKSHKGFTFQYITQSQGQQPISNPQEALSQVTSF